MIKELNDQVLDHAKDTQFAYYLLEEVEGGVWQAGKYNLLGI
ncbi:hypothetical protein [Desulfospira joergensenii]|nr:hypothetical protein [Desulfospira joergensenii]